MCRCSGLEASGNVRRSHVRSSGSSTHVWGCHADSLGGGCPRTAAAGRSLPEARRLPGLHTQHVLPRTRTCSLLWACEEVISCEVNLLAKDSQTFTFAFLH